MALKNTHFLTILVQTCMIMLIFCFTGCAVNAGFCKYYRSACWGAHGKRSDIQNISTIRILAAKNQLNASQNSIAPFFKTQWILSRLITGQPMLPLTEYNKYLVRWDSFPKDKSYSLPKWDHDVTTTDENIESIRISTNIENEDNKRKISNTQDNAHAIRNMNEKYENNLEILISPGEYDNPINDIQKLNILKFLNERNEDTK